MPSRVSLTSVLSLGLAWMASSLAVHAEFSVSGRQILKDGQPFTIKGVCYNPTPIGENGSRAPNGDYFTSGYSALWDRDLPQLRALGANVLRIYGWAPTADHSAFLSRCYNGGDHPLYVLVNYWVDPSTDWSNTKSVSAISTNFINIESRLGANPAVLGLIVGNEVNSQNSNGYKPQFWAAINTVAGAVKRANAKRLVTTAITDSIDQLAGYDAVMKNIDFWCMQIYRGTSFGSFFGDFAARSSRPVVISEYGLDAFDHAANAVYPNNAAFPADVLSNLWIEIVKASSVCAGGCVFEYCDEWFRAPGGTDSTQDPGGWFTSGFPDGCADEEWWGLFSIAKNGTLPNKLTPRASFYELSALWNSTPGTGPVVPPPPPPPATSPSSNFPDATFESVRTGTDSFSAFVVAPAISGWTFASYAGVSGNNSGYTSGNPAAPDGSQVAFIQGQGAISAQLSLNGGTYRISAQTANRANWGGLQTVVVTVDGAEVGRFTGGTFYALSKTSIFSVTTGLHTVQFGGQATSDSTLFLDLLDIQPATSPVSLSSAGFETPDVGANSYLSFLYDCPTISGTQDWTFSGSAGISGLNSGFTSGNPGAPEGKQVAFLQSSNSVVSQSVAFPASGSFQLSVSAAQRGNWNQSRQVIQVYLDSTLLGVLSPANSTYQTIVLPFSTTAGSHLIAFKGTATDDSTAFIDNPSIRTDGP